MLQYHSCKTSAGDADTDLPQHKALMPDKLIHNRDECVCTLCKMHARHRLCGYADLPGVGVVLSTATAAACMKAPSMPSG